MQRIGASSMHLVPGRPPSLRVQRRVVELDESLVTVEQIEEFVQDLLFSDHRELLVERGQVEVLYMGRDGRRYRACVAECAGQRSLTMRPLPSAVPTLEELELPGQVAALARHGSGLVLCAGFFGAGKSTTLAALVNELNQDAGRHIVTIEDSIEFIHESGFALLHQQEIGTHVNSAVEGIRQAVALGADTIVLSELQGSDMIEAVLSAVESGCQVFCGVESGSVVGALNDLVLSVPRESRSRLCARISRILCGVTAQFLLPRSHRAGRVAVVEVLVASPAVRVAIRDGRFQELPDIMHRCGGVGMQTAQAALHALELAHLVNPGDVQLYLSANDGKSGSFAGDSKTS